MPRGQRTAFPGNFMTSVHILSGFLGAGKTSVLRHLTTTLAEDGSRTVLLINEFGSLGLDGKLLADSGLNLYEINKGCICCTLTDDLRETLRRIIEEHAPHRIVIESSGVANPRNICQVAQEPALRSLLRIAGLTTVVDARVWQYHEALGTLFMEQLQCAGQIILNKIDLLGEDESEAVSRAISERIPGVAIHKAVHGNITPEVFWGSDASQLPARPASLTRLETDVRPFVSASFVKNGCFDKKAFIAFINARVSGIERAKGQVVFPGESVFMDIAGGSISYKPPVPGIKGIGLTFIGRGLDADELTASLESLLMQ